MEASSWMLRRLIQRPGFSRNKHRNKEDDVNVDVNNDPRQTITNILSAICQTSDLTDGKRLNYLNAFVKVTLSIEGNFENYGFVIEDVLICLRIALLHESTQVRSGGLRAIRHVLRNDNDINHLNNLLIPFLISRSLDLVLRNDVERIEALKLVRKILLLSPINLHVALARSLVSLANGGMEEKDRMLRICLATLCEVGVLNTNLFVETGGVTAITRNILECQTPKISESLCGVLLLLLDKPATRIQSTIDLHSIVAPYCDFHYRHSWKDKDKYVDERELRFNCSRLALLSILRSWPGILHFCGPLNNNGLKAIVKVLYLNQLEVRKAVLDLLYELLGLPQPEWTDEFSVALGAVDPCEPQSSWRLNEGFVAAEGRSILPHLAKTTPSISTMHLSVLLYSFLECGLLGAIVEVIATSDTFISVRATVLLGELLHLIQILLPPECCNISPALPTLLKYATYGKPQAVKAVNGLQQLQKLLRARPASYSLQLDFILRSGSNVKYTSKGSKKSKHKFKNFKSKLQQWVNRDGDDVVKETGVLLNKDAYTWNWNLIRIVLKGEAIKIDVSDISHRNLIKRIVDFYIPSNNRYSHMDLSSGKISLAYTTTGIELITCLLELADEESKRLLRELFVDISEQIIAITSSRTVHDCLFSPQHMNSTQCQSYFLFIGRLGTTDVGVNILNGLDMFNHLENLATTTNNDCYLKLIISSLDYSSPGPCRELLKSVLKCQVESSRLYGTQFLLVLLRAGINNFHDWGVKLLVNQLQDKSRSVHLVALSTLHEAAEIRDCLETLVKLNPDLTHLGEKGLLLKIRLLSVISGFQMLNHDNFITAEIKKWDGYFNFRYTKIADGETSDVLTLHQRDEDGKYDKRTSAIRGTSRKDFFLPPHLYGQLARHSEGSLLLTRCGSLETMLKCLELGLCESDDEILKLKAALWAIGHFGSTTDGLIYLILHNCLPLMISLAEDSFVLSVRATAYYAVGLIASTREGADELFKLGWLCTRHNRHINWPIIEEESWNTECEHNLGLQSRFFERTSELYFFDSGIKDVEGSTDDDNSESIAVLSENKVIGNKKSQTLPLNQNQIYSYHKRSLSESKTFELIRVQEKKNVDRERFVRLGYGMGRVRNNSTTESTTSGVSSCDSACGGKPNLIHEHQQILSPIPSSCSLSTMNQGGQKIRRYSESSRRVSVQSGSNSDKSSPPLVGSAPLRLSYQNQMGYATLRSLRKSLRPKYFEELSYETDNPSSDVHETLWNTTFSDDFNNLDSSYSCLKRFSIQETGNEERCYLGITLPQDIRVLFLDVPNEIKNCDTFSLCDEVISAPSEIVLKENTQYTHDVKACLKCSTKQGNEDNHTSPTNIDVSVVSEILHLVDQFSNPVWWKQAKQSLLLCKQSNPLIFQDVCVYSEVCSLLSKSTYRLSPRRMLHELFLELNLKDLCLAATDNFKKYTINANHSKCSTDPQTSQTKNLGTLKLAYKENKFPIRNRNESKIV